MIDPEPEPDLYPPLTPVKALSAVAPTANEILQQQCKRLLSQSSVVCPSPTTPPLYQPKEQSLGLLGKCREEALRRGDLQSVQAMPVFYKPNQPPEFRQLPYDVVKEVRNSMRDYGLQASFSMNLLQAIGESYTMTPIDWRLLLRLVLSAAQYSLWSAEYRDLAIAQAVENSTNGVASGQRELLGEGQYATGAAQAALNHVVFTQATIALPSEHSVEYRIWVKGELLLQRSGRGCKNPMYSSPIGCKQLYSNRLIPHRQLTCYFFKLLLKTLTPLVDG